MATALLTGVSGSLETPETDSDQHDPGDVTLFHEEARDVVLALDDFFVAFCVRHFLVQFTHGGSGQ